MAIIATIIAVIVVLDTAFLLRSPNCVVVRSQDETGPSSAEFRNRAMTNLAYRRSQPARIIRTRHQTTGITDHRIGKIGSPPDAADSRRRRGSRLWGRKTSCHRPR